MKVCTDSCLFAGLVAKEESSAGEAGSIRRILDAGAGTGLLSLMLAQEFPQSTVAAIENHPGSAADCRENFLNSAWSDRLMVYEQNVEETAGLFEDKFDLVVCNPPFFLSHLPSPDKGRNSAMHTDGEGLFIWLKCVKENLADGGRGWMLLSADAAEKLGSRIVQSGLYLARRIRLIREPGIIWREILCLKLLPVGNVLHEDVIVLNENGSLSITGQGLMAAYYL
jgi:tRNA1Val (adenine37-N6)-methyltransferase